MLTCDSSPRSSARTPPLTPPRRPRRHREPSNSPPRRASSRCRTAASPRSPDHADRRASVPRATHEAPPADASTMNGEIHPRRPRWPPGGATPAATRPTFRRHVAGLPPPRHRHGERVRRVDRAGRRGCFPGGRAADVSTCHVAGDLSRRGIAQPRRVAARAALRTSCRARRADAHRLLRWDACPLR